MNSNIIKIGIDFGKTIGLIENESPYPDCISTINFLKNKFGSDNIYIISKAKTEMSDKILNWLDKINFYKRTSFLKNNVIFCENYSDKALIVEKLKINIFIDDHIKVIQSMILLKQIKLIIWFNKNVDIKLIDKKFRSKIQITTKWSSIIKFIKKSCWVDQEL